MRAFEEARRTAPSFPFDGPLSARDLHIWNAALDHAANLAGRHAFLNQDDERSCAVCEEIVKAIEKEKV